MSHADIAELLAEIRRYGAEPMLDAKGRPCMRLSGVTLPPALIHAFCLRADEVVAALRAEQAAAAVDEREPMPALVLFCGRCGHSFAGEAGDVCPACGSADTCDTGAYAGEDTCG